MKSLITSLVLVWSAHVLCQVRDSFDITEFLVNIKSSPSLSNAFSKLNRIQTSETKEKFNIVHFGDSHIQGDFFSGEIRRLLQAEFGFAGQGILFPYSLCKSYGPKGIKASTSGLWTGTNILKNTEKKNTGVTGYTLYTTNSNAAIKFEVTDKFNGKSSNRIAIWSSSDSSSYDYKMNDEFKLIEEKEIGNNIKYKIYESNYIISSFDINILKVKESNNKFYFHGFEFLNNDFGINYHHLGVVGAQFTHLINNAELAESQINQMKPDLIIFSFGTNEAYDQNVDTNYYYRSITNFIQKIQKSNPEIAFLLTTAPDTRSQGRTPPNQRTVNRQLERLAKELDLSLFDLNKAMGGWGSLYRWYEQKLTLDDKLHFNSNGYSLQGKMFTHSIFKEYNHVIQNQSIDLIKLENQLHDLLKPIFYEPLKKEVIDTNVTIKKTENVEIENKPKQKAKNQTYVVKSGDTISEISRKYRTTTKAILKANNLKENSIIRPGQKLLIPRN
jgi:lysophospholipase L1-like esterase/LysM repeat protein